MQKLNINTHIHAWKYNDDKRSSYFQILTRKVHLFLQFNFIILL